MPGWWYVDQRREFSRPHDRDARRARTGAARSAVRRSIIRGDQEDPENYPAERFRDRAGGTCDVEIVPDCDHFYVGREDAICDLVAGWLARTLGLSEV